MFKLRVIHFSSDSLADLFIMENSNHWDNLESYMRFIENSAYAVDRKDVNTKIYEGSKSLYSENQIETLEKEILDLYDNFSLEKFNSFWFKM